MASTLQLLTGSLVGAIGGKALRCVVNPPSGGTAPAAGRYYIQPPVQDVVYGHIAIMTLATGAAASGASGYKEVPGATHAIKFITPAMGKVVFMPGGASGYKEVPGATQAVKFITPAMGKIYFTPGGASGYKWAPGSAGGAGSVYVLSSRLIPGRNCMVVQSNFSDLLDALNREGGALVEVF